MKKILIVIAFLYSGLLMAQTGPSITIDNNTVTIKDEKGNTWIINDNGIIKNGVDLVQGSQMETLDEVADLQDELSDLQETLSERTLSEDDYADLQDELDDLEDALSDLQTTMNTDTLPDTASIQIGKWTIVVKEKPDGSNDVDFSMDKNESIEPIEEDDHDVDGFDTEWGLLSIGYNNYLNADNSTEIPEPYSALEDLHFWGSTDVNFELFKSRISFGKGFINLNYGVGLEWHHYRFDQNFTILPDMDTLTLETETLDYDKNKFNTTHLTLPLSLGFETKPWDTDNSFHMEFGYDPGLRIKGKTKHKIDGNSDTEKDAFNLNQFRQEVNVMIGYGKFNLYASYDLTPMFKEGEGPELHPVSVGIIVRRGF